MNNINKALPIKDYNDIACGIRGYFEGNQYVQVVNYVCKGGSKDELKEIGNGFDSIKEYLGVNKGVDALFEKANYEESNYWYETDNFYYWARIIPRIGDYNLYVKAYRKE